MSSRAARVAEANREVQGRDPLFARLVVICVAGLLALGMIGFFTYMSLSHRQQQVPGQTTTQQVSRTVSGKSAEEDKQAAMAALTKLLQAAAESPVAGLTSEQRMQRLDKGDYSVISPAVASGVYFSDGAPEGLKITTYQALISMGQVASTKSSSKTISPTSSTAWQNAYGEPELGTVFIPFSSYVTGGNPFSVEMVYLDGTWKLAPYSLADMIRLSSLWSSGNPTAAPSK